MERGRGNGLSRSSKSHRRKMHDRPARGYVRSLHARRNFAGRACTRDCLIAARCTEIEIPPRGSSSRDFHPAGERTDVISRSPSVGARRARTDPRGRKSRDRRAGRGEPSPTKTPLLPPSLRFLRANPRVEISIIRRSRETLPPRLPIKRFIPAVLFRSSLRFRLSRPDLAKSAYRIAGTHRLFGAVPISRRARRRCISARGCLIDVGGGGETRVCRSMPSCFQVRRVEFRFRDMPRTRCRMKRERERDGVELLGLSLSNSELLRRSLRNRLSRSTT